MFSLALFFLLPVLASFCYMVTWAISSHQWRKYSSLCNDSSYWVLCIFCEIANGNVFARGKFSWETVCTSPVPQHSRMRPLTLEVSGDITDVKCMFVYWTEQWSGFLSHKGPCRSKCFAIWRNMLSFHRIIHKSAGIQCTLDMPFLFVCIELKSTQPHWQGTCYKW